MLGVAPTACKRRLRAALSCLHLWVGLTVGTVFALVGLSGSVLVFHDDLLQWQQPQLAGHELVVDGEVLEGILRHWQPQGLRSIHLPQEEGLPVWQDYFERSEEHTSELQSLMRISYAVFCLKKKT